MIEKKGILLESAKDLDPVSDNGRQDSALENDMRRETQQDMLDWFRDAPMRMPRSQPELFQILALYNPHIGWDTFAEMIDFTGVMPRQIYQVVLDRSPESAQHALLRPNYDARKHFREALLSREFRTRILRSFLRAYPSKGRDVFIHVPKCAGTDLILNLGRRSVPLPKMLESDGWMSDDAFLEIIGGLARAAMTSERFFVYGHMQLGGYVESVGARSDDSIFTILRDPVDLMVSQANYVIGRLRQDPSGRDPDVAEYLRSLDLQRLPEQMSSGDLKGLALKALLHPEIARPNPACFHLGCGTRPVYASALENLIVHNVEITTTKNYDRWLKDRWGIGESKRHNSSEPLLSNAEARRLCSAELAASTKEDQKLYDIVSWALLQAGSTSVIGHELARLVGPPLTEALRANAGPSLPIASGETSTGQKILAAQDGKNVEMYLATVASPVPGIAKMETVVAVGFGANAGGDQYLLEGWARAEEKFTWTAAERCTIRLPTLPDAGRFVVRFTASPFVVKQRLPFQEVELVIGGVLVGTCEVRDISVIEAEVPADLPRDGKPVTITLRLPSAMRPNTISDSKDDRLLALAMRSMTVLQVVPAAAAASSEGLSELTFADQ
jgi:hypothetical protein